MESSDAIIEMAYLVYGKKYCDNIVSSTRFAKQEALEEALSSYNKAQSSDTKKSLQIKIQYLEYLLEDD